MSITDRNIGSRYLKQLRAILKQQDYLKFIAVLVNTKISLYLQFLQKPSLLYQYVSQSCQAKK